MITKETIVLDTMDWVKLQDRSGFCLVNTGSLLYAFTERDQKPDDGVTGNFTTGSSCDSRIEVATGLYLWGRCPSPGYETKVVPNY